MYTFQKILISACMIFSLHASQEKQFCFDFDQKKIDRIKERRKQQFLAMQNAAPACVVQTDITIIPEEVVLIEQKQNAEKAVETKAKAEVSAPFSTEKPAELMPSASDNKMKSELNIQNSARSLAATVGSKKEAQVKKQIVVNMVKSSSPYNSRIPFVPTWRPQIKPNSANPQKLRDSIENLQIKVADPNLKISVHALDIKNYIVQLNQIVDNPDIKNRTKDKHEPRDLAWEAIEIALYFERYEFRHDVLAKNSERIKRVLDAIGLFFK